MSSTSTRLPFRLSGTSPLTMRCARPSTIAVLPTPGSPISTGLFLVRRCRIWMQRRISSSRPMTGSSLPLRARSVRSRVYFASAWRWPSSACEETFSPPRTCSTAFSRFFFSIPLCLKSLPSSPLSAAQASRNSSEAMYWSPRFCASLSATFSRLRQVARDVHFARRALDLGDAAESLGQSLPERVRIAARLRHQPGDAALLLAEEREQQVRGLDLPVILAERETLGLGQPRLQLGGELVVAHSQYFGTNAPISSAEL